MPTKPELIENVLAELARTLHGIDPQQLNALEAAILNAKRIFLAGKGRTGLQIKAFAMRLMHLGLSVHVVDDVTTPGISKDDLLIIGSGSGRTASLLRYAELCQARQIPLAVLTGNPDSALAHSAQVVVHIPASNPKAEGYDPTTSVLAMGSLFEHSLGLLCDLLILSLMTSCHQNEDEMFSRHANLE
jgi:6-phospho-3-hexuloisomerase